jgi:hypothetical protein
LMSDAHPGTFFHGCQYGSYEKKSLLYF